MKAFIIKLKTIFIQNKILILFFLIVLLYVFIYICLFNPKERTDNTLIGIVTEYKIKDNKLTITLDNKAIVNYYFKDELDIHYGDKIKVVGNYTDLKENTNYNMFNYKKYLYSNGIYYMFNADKISIIKKNNNYIYIIKNKIVNRINNIKYSKKYLYIFLLSNKSYLEDDLYTSYKNLGLIHLICISGMHISLFISLLKKLKTNNILIYLFLIIYIVILNYSISLIRCLLMFLFKNIRDKHKIKLSNIKLLFIIMLLLLIINPFYIYSISFKFSFIITFGLYYSNNRVNSSVTSFLFSIPILINNYFKINFISLIINIVFIPFISYIIFPFSVLVFVFNSLDRYLYYLTNYMDKMLLKMDEITIFVLSFSKQNILLIIIYYFILILFIKKQKYMVGIIFLITVFYLNGYYVINPRVYYLDVGQGDSSLIRINNNNILIDTGGLYNYSLSDNLIIPFLRSIGVKKIDYLILTHGDFDHIGESINLVKNYKVEKVIFNCGPYNDLEKELIKVLDKKHIKYYSCIKELNIDNNKLYFLQTKEYNNENDNSNVIYTKFNGYKFMFMGDASITTEHEILNKYNLSDINVLKVGHHGSRTSSSKQFIDKINPKYSIISVGKNNRYGHPNKEVLNNLRNSKIYRTDEDGSIMFKIKDNKLNIETCSP